MRHEVMEDTRLPPVLNKKPDAAEVAAQIAAEGLADSAVEDTTEDTVEETVEDVVEGTTEDKIEDTIESADRNVSQAKEPSKPKRAKSPRGKEWREHVPDNALTISIGELIAASGLNTTIVAADHAVESVSKRPEKTEIVKEDSAPQNGTISSEATNEVAPVEVAATEVAPVEVGTNASEPVEAQSVKAQSVKAQPIETVRPEMSSAHETVSATSLPQTSLPEERSAGTADGKIENGEEKTYSEEKSERVDSKSQPVGRLKQVPSLGTSPTALQDLFLNSLRRDQIDCIIYFTDGSQERGLVRAYDTFTILLENRNTGKVQLIYKHCIGRIHPVRTPPALFDSTPHAKGKWRK